MHMMTAHGVVLTRQQKKYSSTDGVMDIITVKLHGLRCQGLRKSQEQGPVMPKGGQWPVMCGGAMRHARVPVGGDATNLGC